MALLTLLDIVLKLTFTVLRKISNISESKDSKVCISTLCMKYAVLPNNIIFNFAL